MKDCMVSERLVVSVVSTGFKWVTRGRPVLVALFTFLALLLNGFAGVDYDIVYVRSPRPGDEIGVRLPEVKDPIHVPPGTDLVLLHADGNEEVLVAGGHGAVVDPYVSFDGKWVLYAKFHDTRKEALNYQRRDAARGGADLFKIHLETREVIQLTFQEWTPNTGVVAWSNDPLRADPPGTYYLGYGIFNLGPCPLPGGRIMFTSSRNGFVPNNSYTFPNLQLFVMDEDGSNVEQIGHMNLGSALHPTILSDGRVMFSSYEAQGLRDSRLWGLWAIWPDGRAWEPLMSALTAPSAFHFQTELTNGDIAVVEYYNQNNNGFGTVLAFPSRRDESVPPFGPAARGGDGNSPVQTGIWWFDETHPSHRKPRYKRYPFSPQGLYGLTPFSHGEDNASSRTQSGDWAGKVTQPSGAPGNDVLIVWSRGPANDLNRPTSRPTYDAGLYLLRGGVPADDPADLVAIRDRPDFNELQPRAVVTYRAIYGVDEPRELPWLPNDGSGHPELPAGTPFGLIGTSSFYKRDTSPGSGRAEFDGLDPFNTSQNGASSNWGSQGADAGRYSNADIWAIRILAMEPTSHTSYGPRSNARGFYNHANERLRILGEVPLRKFNDRGEPVLDPEGNPDTSFMAKIPADVPFTFQTIDRDGLVLNMSQTWHQLRPGEVRNDCGGCHAHSQQPLNFSLTAAARSEYSIWNLTRSTPLIDRDQDGEPTVTETDTASVDVEYYRDIKPILQRSCVGCHSMTGPAEAGLVLDDTEVVDGFENTYNRLCRDSTAQYGIAPVISNGRWRQTNASRYVRKFQARRSLLVWKVFGRRLDGWSNADHPTETVPGDPATLPDGAHPNAADLDYLGSIMPPPDSGYPPLTEREKRMIGQWVDLGCPIDSPDPELSQYGWFADELRPTLTLTHPRAGRVESPLTEIRIGAHDYYSGLATRSLSVYADFVVNGLAPGTDLGPHFETRDDDVRVLRFDEPIVRLRRGELRVSVRDRRGNVARLVRTFRVGEDSSRRRPRLVGPRVRDGRLSFMVADSEAGRTYRLERSDDLRSWSNVREVAGSGEAMSVDLNVDRSAPSRFYRVTVLPSTEL